MLYGHVHQTGTPLLWVGVTVAMITRWPFIQPLSYCLRHSYLVEILPNLDRWELNNFFSHNIQTPVTPKAHGQPVGLNIEPLSLSLSHILVKLCKDYPVPVPGLFHLNVKFRSLNYGPLGADYFGTPLSTYDGEESVDFRLPLAKSLPYCPYPLEALLHHLGPRLIVDTLLCALFECKLLFHSTDLAMLPGK
jgi:hypothetical protein